MDLKTQLEIERKVKLGIPLTDPGNIENLAYYQQYQTALQAQLDAERTSTTGGGVGTGNGTTGSNTGMGGVVNPNAIPGATAAGITKFGFSGIVSIGVAFIFVSLLMGFKRARGR